MPRPIRQPTAMVSYLDGWSIYVRLHIVGLCCKDLKDYKHCEKRKRESNQFVMECGELKAMIDDYKALMRH